MPPLRLRYTDEAQQDLREVLRYGMSEGFPDTLAVVNEIEQRISTLASHPAAGRKGREPGTREWVLGGLPFIVVYALHPHEQTPSEVHILNIVHGARRWPPRPSS
ncbi:type II toxin-antitoxin system RelE/ParE family toxin [Lysobacter sp. A289]